MAGGLGTQNVKNLVFLAILCLSWSYTLFLSLPPIADASDLSLLPPVATSNATSSHPAASIPLRVLTDSDHRYECPEGLMYFSDRIQIPDDSLQKRKIPRIVHLTSKSRCLTPPFVKNLQKWQFHHHSVFFHDDAAVDRLLLQTFWPSFPHIPVAMQCLRSGAAKADLWRYLALWEYRGIYTDIDNAPGPFWNESLIQPNDDAFFVVEKLGVLSQYFLAVSPKHPLMFLAVHQTLHRLLDVEHVGKQYIPTVTGPGALKVAFKYFMRTQDSTKYGRVQEGTYVGVGGRSVRVAGTKDTGWKYVRRGSVPEKIQGYVKMNMKHFSSIAKKKFNETCMVHLFNLEYGTDHLNMSNW